MFYLASAAVALLVALASAAPTDQSALAVTVFVPLCDSALIDCGRGALGDPRSLQGNLYWGARYGAERYLSRLPDWRVIAQRDGSGPVLRETSLLRSGVSGERAVRLTLRAYAGDHIDEALADFLTAVEGRGAQVDLVVWAGHDRLMDVPAPKAAPPTGAPGLPSAVLACSSATVARLALTPRRPRRIRRRRLRGVRRVLRQPRFELGCCAPAAHGWHTFCQARDQPRIRSVKSRSGRVSVWGW